MDVTPTVPDSRMLIDSYGPGRFRVRGQAFEGSLLVFPTQVMVWPVTSINELSVEVLAPVREADPAVEVLLLGTGSKMTMASSDLRREIRSAGIVMDIMDTGAACRTFNVLMVEGRRAAAALIAE